MQSPAAKAVYRLAVKTVGLCVCIKAERFFNDRSSEASAILRFAGR
jgi:hypothetical protein